MELTHLLQSQFVSGGLLLMAVGGLVYYLRSLKGFCHDLIERFFLLKIEILDSDEAYQWMQVWLADRLQKTLSVSVLTKRGSATDLDPGDDDYPRRDNRPEIYFVPAVGTYFFWYRGRFVMLNRHRDESSTNRSLLADRGSDSKGLPRDKESFTIRIFSSNKALGRQLIEECRERALPVDGKLDILVANYGHWTLGTRVQPRPLASVILDGGQADEILADMQAFLSGADWYRRIGVPYRRGYLLYGPPGNGKTSIVKALAGELKMSVHLLMLSDPSMNDNRLNDLLGKVAERNILLLEDIDCAFVKRKRASGRDGELTFSGLLNALDGVASPEGRIVVMTTNHVEKLDPALIRPGRADVRLMIGNATTDQARRLFERFFPDDCELSWEFAQKLADGQHSMATLQDYLMAHRHDSLAAAREVQNLASPPRQDRFTGSAVNRLSAVV